MRYLKLRHKNCVLRGIHLFRFWPIRSKSGEMMKAKLLSKLILVFISTTVLGLFFQNCNSTLSSQKNFKVASGLLGNFSLLSSKYSTSNANLDSFYSSSRGFIFYGKYDIAQNSADKTGAQICDYPSLKNCHTHAEGRGRGASTVMRSGVDPSLNVHVATFQFYSDGFLTKNKNSHFALGIRATYYLEKGVDGRGAILGNLWGIEKNQANPLCQGMMMQVESFFKINELAGKGPGNTVYPETCSGAIFQERTTYNMEVYVSRDNKIGYKVKDANGNLISEKLIQDSYDLIDRNLTDAFIAHVFDIEILNRSDEWRLIIDKINFSGSNSAIENFFSRPVSPPVAVPVAQPASNPVPAPAPVPSQPAPAPATEPSREAPAVVVPFKTEDQSVGNGAIVTRLIQKIYGVGPDVKACTNPMSQYNNACQNISDFRFLRDVWGSQAYDAANNVWRINVDVSADGYPFQSYFTRFLLSDGKRKEAIFSPSRVGEW